ncbi:4'-phosphopantetheinyl transferase superfamily protein [Streptomyces sp. ISL-100]|uniref:4'-phosphopantetheinyl transferase family protein n=1 Tax=Streptomyces sp. ISL-100 TaxID=2819173 RepID=UPI001BE7CA0E|nr:4'-phosphopantetheinyl transferase superfamily protein [Streptomyces sp. ISL-100]MBT2401572.1 4'-phosphopantetheinyl transferase superfamily protein [Streptomyces sp. ISL-100]
MEQLLDTVEQPAGNAYFDEGRAPTTGECHLWCAPIGTHHGWMDVLAPEERVRASQLPAGSARDTFVTSRGLQRTMGAQYLGAGAEQLRIVRTCPRCDVDHGRPRFDGADIDYSVAHTRRWVLLAVVSEGLVGVDLDTVPARRVVDRLAPTMLTPGEQESLERTAESERATAFLRLWARKEAAAKLTGRGLAASIAQLDVTEATLAAPPTGGVAAIHLLDVPAGDGHVVAVATTHRIDHVLAYWPGPGA